MGENRIGKELSLLLTDLTMDQQKRILYGRSW
jgi:hypothetical protein